MDEKQKYEAQGWEVVPMRSIRTAQTEKPAFDPLKALDEGLRQLFPAEARLHFHTAQRELLLAVRSIVDAALERTEQDVQRETNAEKPQ